MAYLLKPVIYTKVIFDKSKKKSITSKKAIDFYNFKPYLKIKP